MAQFWRTKEFKNLEDIWNEKLKDSGFLDHESDKGKIKKNGTENNYLASDQLLREVKEEYHSQIGYFANNTDVLNGEKDLSLFVYACFPNELEKLVMVRHSEGATIKEIVEEIHVHGLTRDRKTIRYIIRRWQMKWGIKSWSLRQMNLKK